MSQIKVVDLVGPYQKPEYVSVKYWDDAGAHESWFIPCAGGRAELGEQVTDNPIPSEILILMENEAKQAFIHGIPSPKDSFRRHGTIKN